MKKSKVSASMSSSMCKSEMGNQIRGKALLNLGLAVVLLAYGFSLIGFALMVQVVGLIFALKGIVQLKHSNCHGCC